MTPDELLAWVAQQQDVCICGKLIPANAIYYGFPMGDDADAPLAFVNEWHDHCLGEFGWERSNFGITHVGEFCPERLILGFDATLAS